MVGNRSILGGQRDCRAAVRAVLEQSATRGSPRSAFRWLEATLRVLVACAALAGVSLGQQAPTRDESTVTPLAPLLREADQNNPQIRAARQAWQAAEQIPTQVSTLPDPEFQLQHFTVGSPRPFAGYTNSDFAYIGLGVSQDFPYPGKLRLKREIAQRGADVLAQEYESVRRTVFAEVKSVYFQLAYLSKTLAILQSDEALLQQAEKAADARYRSGMGNQEDLLEAQLQQTKLLREITLHHLEAARLQARLKELLSRPQSTADVQPAGLAETPLPYTYQELLDAARARNPQIAGAREAVDRQQRQVDLARKDFYPDFNLQYMWERTDPTQFRAYYMLTFGVRVPVYRSRKQRPELAQAQTELSRARSDFEVRSQQVAAELRSQYDTAQKTAELLNIYKQGMLPQARAAFAAALAAYENNRENFVALQVSFLDVLHLDEDYWRDVAERETALARLEELSGLTLGEEGAKP